MNKNLLVKNYSKMMFTAIMAAFFAIEIINSNKKDIIINCGNISVNNNIILGGIYNDTQIFN
ncbi:hypothetical protein [Metamycoplasma gateae]|uniref:Uncharacterized protein n=1 Tax=Metamycoplasma gateae TaxID=35769 RepID=A0ABZ2AHB5_9BACT|nr:hypothetical protein V2E26_00745 [Metamycoplasma gateae]